MSEEYKVCYSVKTGRGAGNERYTWVTDADEEQVRRGLEQAEDQPVTVYWMSRELGQQAVRSFAESEG